MDSYRALALLYDDLLGGVWERHGRVLQPLVPPGPGRAWDLGCGTGLGARWLMDRGWDVVGVDRSAAMLDLARPRCPTAEFMLAHMERLPLVPPMDVAICCFDAVNYLLTESDWRSFFAGVRRGLRKGAVFVFDMLPEQSLPRDWPQYREVLRCERGVVASVGSFDSETGIATTRDLIFIGEGDLYRCFEEVHRQTSFPLRRVRAWLRRSGFSVDAVLDEWGGAPHARSVRLLLACRAE